jgi:hypothetical protein
MASRSAEEVLQDHLRRSLSGDDEGDAERNYRDDSVILTSDGLFRGRPGVLESRAFLARAVTEATVEVKQSLAHDELVFIEWTATVGGAPVCDGADTLVIRDGYIHVHTMHYKILT